MVSGTIFSICSWIIPLDRYSNGFFLSQFLSYNSGHTFSKLLEMVPGADIFHGEAVNIDGFFCVVLSHLRGFINIDTVNRILSCMKSLLLPTNCSDLKLHLAWQSCKDAIEHRHGEQRIPLITEIGESICVSDITEEELDRALNAMKQFMH